MAEDAPDRVMFDSNDGDLIGGYPLWFDQSKRDLARIGARLKEGLVVEIYMPDELECLARLEFDESQGCWIGIPLEDQAWRVFDKGKWFEDRMEWLWDLTRERRSPR